MPTITTTTTVNRSERHVPADLHDEALALAQRVTHRIQTPLPVLAVETVAPEAEYEPQSWTMPPSRSGFRDSGI